MSSLSSKRTNEGRNTNGSSNKRVRQQEDRSRSSVEGN